MNRERHDLFWLLEQEFVSSLDSMTLTELIKMEDSVVLYFVIEPHSIQRGEQIVRLSFSCDTATKWTLLAVEMD